MTEHNKPPMDLNTSEATQKQLELTREQGEAYGRALAHMTGKVAHDGGEQEAGHYLVGYAVEEAEGMYAWANGGLVWREPGEEKGPGLTHRCSLRKAPDVGADAGELPAGLSFPGNYPVHAALRFGLFTELPRAGILGDWAPGTHLLGNQTSGVSHFSETRVVLLAKRSGVLEGYGFISGRYSGGSGWGKGKGVPQSTGCYGVVIRTLL